jgi:hypothetical protein
VEEVKVDLKPIRCARGVAVVQEAFAAYMGWSGPLRLIALGLCNVFQCFLYIWSFLFHSISFQGADIVEIQID